MSGPEVRTDSLGGGRLTRAALDGRAPAAWYVRRPDDADGWRERAEAVRTAFSSGAWLEALEPAIAAGGLARARLHRVRDGGGVLITTGQQPGLFGGPLYTWIKALSALTLADAIERATGIPTAPLFWAATDDSDFAEASWTVIATATGAERLSIEPARPAGPPMSAMPLGPMAELLDRLITSAGTVLDPVPIGAVRDAYRDDATIGGAYVALLRRLLEPHGIPVLDASHPAVGDASRPLLLRALDLAEPVGDALRAREAEITGQGFDPQVTSMPGLSLVFDRSDDRKARIPIARARAAADGAVSGVLAPNVLLRPVVERALMPTIAYVAGPAEIAYFAQVGAVAKALGAATPLAVPRWSCTIIEPHIARILTRFGVDAHDLADPHAPESRIARAATPPASAQALRALGAALDERLAEARTAIVETDRLLPPAVLDGVSGAMHHRLQRLERRLLAAVKRREHDAIHQLAVARGALYPFGFRQERALNAIPVFARHGTIVVDRMIERARAHAHTIVRGTSRQDATVQVAALESDAIDAGAR